jgi:thiamine-phosphate pyrophosphorylase
MLLYYITDRKGFGGTWGEQRLALLRRIADAARAGVDYIQLREKDLPARELERLASEATRAVHDNGSARLLINGRTDIALACGADGVHLPSSELPAAEVRALWRTCSTRCPSSPGVGRDGPRTMESPTRSAVGLVEVIDRDPLIGISAHSLADLRQARAQGAEFAVLAPIFEKVQFSLNGIGVETLREACSALRAEAAGSSQFTVLALGGVNLTNAHACLEAGAAGVAGIRLFQSGDIFQTVRRLRGCGNPDEYD